MLSLIFTPAAHADNLEIGLNVSTTSGGVLLLVPAEIDLPGVQEFLYSETITDVLNTRTTDFSATFIDLLGIETVTVIDVCTQITIAGPATPCQGLAFAFEDLSIGTLPHLVLALGSASTLIDGNIGEIDFDASLGGGSAVFNFPPVPPVAPTPEPASLSLAATGLLGVAGMVRRKMRLSV